MSFTGISANRLELLQIAEAVARDADPRGALRDSQEVCHCGHLNNQMK